ncbi:cytochrome c peroxidase [Wenyingzhuangia heitensis]|uniref:Cytochrome c peroxidase n=1 Tax=Wenyingzhuangia heitensis TaxID=1487859 RepID=A0ABX0U9M3_9FLAO|nr:cytochrome c peroxidase [Wenyingzhuangia heitensis]NIJ45525.1 cytochrome c peroxidase [Wenyingzhuangia heitensis]
MKNRYRFTFIVFIVFFSSCTKESYTAVEVVSLKEELTHQNIIDEILKIDLTNLLNYENQNIPNYIIKDNTPVNNSITNAGATLGRVLFYDKKLSSNNTISCASCHQQEFAFSDRAQFSQGVNGQTLRHSTRLINARFSDEVNFFWDERASSLEMQATMPIKDHSEMGFSGLNGAPNFQDLIIKLSATTYYPILFKKVYDDVAITEERMGKALSQFIRSIQSFDSKYDIGLAQVNSHTDDFPNFTTEENKGKRLFTEDFKYVIESVTIEKFGGDLTVVAAHRISGGLNCASCHRAPEFDIDPLSLNNGFDRPLNGNSLLERDFTVTRSPTLRDLIRPNGELNELNSPMFHAGTTNDLLGGIIANYNFKDIHTDNHNLDARLTPEGYPQFLDMNTEERNQLMAFLNTLTGSDAYINTKWSNPFR